MSAEVQGIPLTETYSDTYYYDTNSVSNDTITRAYGFQIGLVNLILTFLMRAGLILVQLGSIPTRDTNLILLHNVIEIAVATIGFLLVGFIFAFGTDVSHMIGTARWIGSPNANMEQAINGWCMIITATGLATTAVAGRMHLLGYIVVTAVMSMLIGPLLIHWIWTHEGFMHYNRFLGLYVSYKDTGGCLVVHVFGGCVGLIACLFMGRRLLLLSEMDKTSIPRNSPATCILGYLLFMLGLFMLGMPTVLYSIENFTEYVVSKVIVNDIMAIGGGILAVALFHILTDNVSFHYWVIMRCMQGGVAGMVIVAAGVDEYNPALCALLGFIGGTTAYFFSRLLFACSMEDYCNIVPVHFVNGLLGSLIVPFFGETEGFALNGSAGRTVMVHLCWQLICDLITLVLVAVTFVLLIGLLYCLGVMHNFTDGEDNTRAIFALDNGLNRNFSQRLFRLPPYPNMVPPGGYDARELQKLQETSPSAVSGPKKLDVDSGGSRKNAYQTYHVEIETDRPPLGDFDGWRFESEKPNETESKKTMRSPPKIGNHGHGDDRSKVKASSDRFQARSTFKSGGDNISVLKYVKRKDPRRVPDVNGNGDLEVENDDDRLDPLCDENGYIIEFDDFNPNIVDADNLHNLNMYGNRAKLVYENKHSPKLDVPNVPYQSDEDCYSESCYENIEDDGANPLALQSGYESSNFTTLTGYSPRLEGAGPGDAYMASNTEVTRQNKDGRNAVVQSDSALSSSREYQHVLPSESDCYQDSVFTLGSEMEQDGNGRTQRRAKKRPRKRKESQRRTTKHDTNTRCPQVAEEEVPVKQEIQRDKEETTPSKTSNIDRKRHSVVFKRVINELNIKQCNTSGTTNNDETQNGNSRGQSSVKEASARESNRD